MSAQRLFTHADEHHLAWALAIAAAPHMTKRNRAWLWVQIGAGDYRGAIAEALRWQANAGVSVPVDCRDQLLRYTSAHGALAVDVQPKQVDGNGNQP